MNQIDRKLSCTVLAKFMAASRWQPKKIIKGLGGLHLDQSLAEFISHPGAEFSSHLLF